MLTETFYVIFKHCALYFKNVMNNFRQRFGVHNDQHQRRHGRQSFFKPSSSRSKQLFIPYLTILKKCFPQCFNVFLIFFVNLTVFPAINAGEHVIITIYRIFFLYILSNTFNFSSRCETGSQQLCYNRCLLHPSLLLPNFQSERCYRKFFPFAKICICKNFSTRHVLVCLDA